MYRRHCPQTARNSVIKRNPKENIKELPISGYSRYAFSIETGERRAVYRRVIDPAGAGGMVRATYGGESRALGAIGQYR